MARQFGATWWGRAWVEALEGRAQLDPNRLARGRTYARQDRVARLDVGAGRIGALVRGSRVLPYQVRIDVPTFDEQRWAAVVDAVASRAGHAAALLDGVLEPGVLADAHDAGVDLLPGPGDLRPRCSCPDWADPCKHAAAVCYLVADELDDDPFALFALRGRDRVTLLGHVSARRQAAAVPAGSAAGDEAGSASAWAGAGADPGVVARQAWAAEQPPPPTRRELPPEPGAPSWASDPPPDAAFTADGLTAVAIDAARRAWRQLADGEPSHLDLPAEVDLARRATEEMREASARRADADTAGGLDRLARISRSEEDAVGGLARSSGLRPAALVHRAHAWRHAGAEGVAMLDDVLWRPDPVEVSLGLEAFAEIGVGRDQVQVRSNRLTAGAVQLRLGAGGRWWRFERRGERSWQLVEPPADDPRDLLSGAP